MNQDHFSIEGTNEMVFRQRLIYKWLCWFMNLERPQYLIYNIGYDQGSKSEADWPKSINNNKRGLMPSIRDARLEEEGMAAW